MLPRENRLLKKKDFKKVFKKGKGYSDGFLVKKGQEKEGLSGRGIFFLKILENGLGVNRFGVVVSRKVSRKATLRNKIKRRVRESLRMGLPQIKKGFDVIFLASPGIEKEKPADLRKRMEGAFERAKLIKR
jgi:ribonuclease P protein component